MKIKMPCKLCEISLDSHKFEGVGCTHNPFFQPMVQPLGMGLQGGPLSLPQLRDMVLAAYLLRGYYQPAGPLITVPHGHTQPPLVKSAPLSESSHTSSSPVSHGPHPTPTSNNGDSSDNEVQITSVTAGKDVPVAPPSNYRYSQYTPGPPPPHGYSYPYPSHYYHSPAPPTPTYPHHDICYSPSPYLHHKYPPSAYRRYLPTAQYYPPNPGEMYTAPPSGPPPPSSQQVVTATPVSVSNGTTYSPPTVPPQPLIETYPPMVEAYPHPPPHFYPGYTPGPPPACYTHQPPSRAMNFINATYQSCPCPMQSCPKNGLTGPLTGDSKRSNILSKDSMPLPPVALALPLEPASATGPPSPARGSAGMPPPPSPAGATYQPPPTKQESVSPEAIPEEKKRKARVGKAMVRNNIQNTMLLMCNPPNVVKREIESPKDKEVTPEPPKEDTPDVEPKLPPPVQMELKVTIESNPVKLEEKEDAPLEPIVSTVAENVKVKNMKRKLSMTQEVPVSPKKSKTDAKANGSYKDLIKKDSTAVKINNGKRKLIVDSKLPLTRTPKIRCKKPATKRKPSPVKEDAASKKLKLIPPNNNTQDEAVKKVNSKVNCTKKSAPALLDNLIARNTIDRTIECVISGTVRTTTSDKCKTTKEPKNAPKTLKEQEPVVPTLLKRKTPVTSILPATKKKEPPKKTTVLPPAPKKKESAAAAAAVPKKSINAKVAPALVMAKKSARINENRRKSKSREVMQSIPKVPRRSLVAPRWSNGWNWDGEAYEAKVFLNSDETTVVRRCYPAMRHDEGDIIEVRDCVLLKAGPRKNDLPFVAKIAALWENPEDGEMMMSLLWYYRPEHTEQGRLASDQPDEVFASRHKDSNSVACIDDKCYVLTFNEYCRYRKELRRLEEGIEETSPCIPNPEPYPRSHRQPPHQQHISSEMIFFCRKVYDFRQKRIVKNPT